MDNNKSGLLQTNTYLIFVTIDTVHSISPIITLVSLPFTAILKPVTSNTTDPPTAVDIGVNYIFI